MAGIGPITEMIEIEFHIYLASKTRWVHLAKSMMFPAVPRIGEFVKFANAEVGDYFPFEVSDVTYREPGKVEVMTSLLDDVDNRGYSFEDEAEFNEYYESYVAEGWLAPRGVSENARYMNRQIEVT